MISRRVLTILVFGLPVFVVAFGILMGTAALANALQDPFGAKCLQVAGLITAMLLVADVLFLVGILGFEAISYPPVDCCDAEHEDETDSNSADSEH